MKIDYWMHYQSNPKGTGVVWQEYKSDDVRENVKGEWTDDNACPFCGFQPYYERDIHTLSFCPNCGADMRGDKS